MAAIKGRDTRPEMVVRKWLWAHGFRYRLNHGRLPGKPDIVLRKYRTCVFVNGCFWHGHNLAPLEGKGEKMEGKGGWDEVQNSECCKIPRTNRDFWVAKLKRNRERDHEVQRRLAEMGWHSVTVWECELRPKVREHTLQSLAYTLNHIYLLDRRPSQKRYDKDEEGTHLMVAEEP